VLPNNYSLDQNLYISNSFAQAPSFFCRHRLSSVWMSSWLPSAHLFHFLLLHSERCQAHATCMKLSGFKPWARHGQKVVVFFLLAQRNAAGRSHASLSCSMWNEVEKQGRYTYVINLKSCIPTQCYYIYNSTCMCEKSIMLRICVVV
jgi:hypothetical protein